METDIIKQYIIQEDNIVPFDNETYLVKPLFNSKGVESYLSITKKGAANCNIYLRLCSDTAPANKELVLKCSTPDLELRSKMERVPVFNQKVGKYVSRFRIKATVENVYDIIHAKAITLSWNQKTIKAKTSLDDSLLTGFFIQTRGLSCIPESQKEVIRAVEEKAKQLDEKVRQEEMRRLKEEAEIKKKEEEAKRIQEKKKRELLTQENYIKIRILNYLIRNALYVELEDQFIVKDPLGDATTMKIIYEYVIDGFAPLRDSFEFKMADIQPSQIELFINKFPVSVLSKPKTDKDKEYSQFYGNEFHNYRIICEKSKPSDNPNPIDVINVIASNYSCDIQWSNMDFTPKIIESAAKGLARYYISHAVLVKKVLIGSEYMSFSYPSDIYSSKGIYKEAQETLERYGIVSDSRGECFDRDSRYYGQHGYTVYVYDFKAACAKLDGMPPKISPNRSSSSGCYIATCVYGSYDCQEVWTLRRFRDYTLYTVWYGRLFIKTYYAISPTLVRWFGDKRWFQSYWRLHLDKLVQKLQECGYDKTPYNDK